MITFVYQVKNLGKIGYVIYGHLRMKLAILTLIRVRIVLTYVEHF